MRCLPATEAYSHATSVAPVLAQRFLAIARLGLDILAVLAVCLLLQVRRAIAAYLPIGLAGRVRSRRSCRLNLERAAVVAHRCGHAGQRTGLAGSGGTTRRSSC